MALAAGLPVWLPLAVTPEIARILHEEDFVTIGDEVKEGNGRGLS